MDVIRKRCSASDWSISSPEYSSTKFFAIRHHRVFYYYYVPKKSPHDLSFIWDPPSPLDTHIDSVEVPRESFTLWIRGGWEKIQIKGQNWFKAEETISITFNLAQQLQCSSMKQDNPFHLSQTTTQNHTFSLKAYYTYRRLLGGIKICSSFFLTQRSQEHRNQVTNKWACGCVRHNLGHFQ